MSDDLRPDPAGRPSPDPLTKLQWKRILLSSAAAPWIWWAIGLGWGESGTGNGDAFFWLMFLTSPIPILASCVLSLLLVSSRRLVHLLLTGVIAIPLMVVGIFPVMIITAVVADLYRVLVPLLLVVGLLMALRAQRKRKRLLAGSLEDSTSL